MLWARDCGCDNNAVRFEHSYLKDRVNERVSTRKSHELRAHRNGSCASKSRGAREVTMTTRAARHHADEPNRKEDDQHARE